MMGDLLALPGQHRLARLQHLVAVRQLQEEFPDHAIRIIECPEVLGANGKVSNLVQMLPHARPGGIAGLLELVLDHHGKDDIYRLADPRFTGRVTVPVLWDKERRTIVNNESSEIIRMLNQAFDAFTDVRTDWASAESLEPTTENIKAARDPVWLKARSASVQPMTHPSEGSEAKRWATSAEARSPCP